ncbi:MAG TPA: hypothetical protein VLT84_02000 [Acidobacteriota bacterium]|nr:hypothetical protein [Acidobacteriota bacterium]
MNTMTMKNGMAATFMGPEVKGSMVSFSKDVAKVQIFCAYAEVVLGEAAFEKPMM